MDVLPACVYKHILVAQTLVQGASSRWPRIQKVAMGPGWPGGLIATVFQQQGDSILDSACFVPSPGQLCQMLNTSGLSVDSSAVVY